MFVLINMISINCLNTYQVVKPEDYIDTVGQNIIATTKIHNNYGAIQSFISPIL